jgi:hypothetical protein
MPYIYMEKDGICFLAASKVAIWRKPASGDKFAPYKNPVANIALVIFHSDLNYYGVVAKDLARVINHAAVAGATENIGGTGIIVTGLQVETEHVLITHNLGYPPLFFVAYGGQMIPHGIPIQIESGGQRYVIAHATETQIILREVGFSTDVALPAASRTYQVIVFRDLAAVAALPMFQLKPGVGIFGKGKFQLGENHLRQVGAGESPFALQQDVCAAVGNGGLGIRQPDGTPLTIGTFSGTIPNPTVINVGI